MSVQLLQWWLVPVLLLVGILTITGVLLFKRKRSQKERNGDTVLVANSIHVRNTPAYQKALRKLWVQVIIGASIFTLIGTATAVGAGRFIDIKVEHPKKHNRDIVLCLDASGSMYDVDSDILTKFRDLSESFRGERIGLTVFNATTVQVFPLTDDYEYIEHHLERVNSYFTEQTQASEEANSFFLSTLGRADGASLVGDGLYGCSLSFDEQQDENRSRNIILATDNMVNGAELVPFDEAGQIATEQNIRVYGISPESRDNALGGTISEGATNEMKTVVESTGGQFFMLSNQVATNSIIDDISQTEASMMEGNPMILKADTPHLILYIISGGIFALFIFVLWRRF